ncbi:hypothetical protein [Terricaulis silvestris]|uniref:Uncharacterized protein n=1 Tax=Terricaulis silvestris TaxID=2686094 RepID=A0A6I6MHS7_9CAUL|nr:hypothetical protein [Terricaulis silvestris]QGZ93211.1 hypothetical protein DSM104635_00017 [Terricaulis silvestris]
MLGRLAAIAVVAALAGCAGMESAGRNAARDPVASAPTAAPAPRVVASAPTPATAPLPAPVASAPRPTPAPIVTATPAPPPPQAITPRTTAAPAVEDDEPAPVAIDTARRSGSDIIVPGVRERQVQPPRGDPRSTSERMEDIRAWDQCVTRVQAAFESDPMSPQLDSPEEYCSQSLGMAERDAVPLSRGERRRN